MIKLGKCSGTPCAPCSRPATQCEIIYDWAGTNKFDLDTGTEFLGNQIGYACAGGSYLNWITGDDTSQNGNEQVSVSVDSARDDGRWVSSVVITLRAGWYIPAGGSGICVVRVTYNSVTRSKTISPGSQSACASTTVGSITIYSDGTFTLS